MENMSPESLLRKAQALGDDIKEMESIDVLGAYYQAQTKIKTNRRKNMYNQLMRYAAFLTIPLFLWFWDIYILVEQKPTRNMQRW